MPPPPPGQWAPGQTQNIHNTGLAGDNIDPNSLQSLSGTITYGTAFNGQTISLKAYHGTVNISGSHITIKDCSLTYGGLNSFGFDFTQGSSFDTVQNCDITSPAGQSMYEPVFLNPGSDNNSVIANNISRGENLMTTYGTNALIQNNYMHDVALDSNPGDHPDAIEVYGGGPTMILNNRIEEDNLYDAPINVAPYNNYTVHDLTVQGNFLDDGQSNILLDNQNPACQGATGSCLINTRVLHNAFGGHQCPSSNNQCFYIYHPDLLYENRQFIDPSTPCAQPCNNVVWPITGPDVTLWEENTSASLDGSDRPQITLTPDLDGQVVLPS